MTGKRRKGKYKRGEHSRRLRKAKRKLNDGSSHPVMGKEVGNKKKEY